MNDIMLNVFLLMVAIGAMAAAILVVWFVGAIVMGVYDYLTRPSPMATRRRT